MAVTAILPVKRFARAKTRLVETIGPPGRAAILRAMLGDVLASLERSEEIERVVMVTGEGRAEKVALEHAKRNRKPIEVLQDPRDEGHSEAATLGIMRAKSLGAKTCALLPGDCPLLDGGELDEALTALTNDTVGVVPDRHGTGTNALILSPCDAIGPAFGPDSCERHLDRAGRAGWDAQRIEIPSLALDLDTADDLEALRDTLLPDPGRAPLTAAALGEI